MSLSDADRLRLTALLDAMHENVLDESGHQELLRWLRTSEDAQRFYLKYQSMVVSLSEYAREYASASNANGDSAMNWPLLTELEELEPAAPPKQLVDISEELERRRTLASHKREYEEAYLQALFRKPEQPNTVRHIVIPRWLAYGSLSGVAAVIAFMVYAWLPPAPDPVVPQPAPLMVEATPATYGRITAVFNDAAFDDGNQVEVDTPIEAGLLTLMQGSVKLVFDNGAVLVTEAPAVLDVKDRMHVRIAEGRVVGHCPNEASRGFTLLVPEGQIVDIGTTFGVTVHTLGTEVLVYEGEVLAQVTDDQGVATQSLRLTRGEGARAQRGFGGFEPGFVDVTQFGELASITGRSGSLRTLVASRGPLVRNFPVTEHCQGIDLDEQGHIYWSFTDDLFKTDAQGNVRIHVAVEDHQGDIAYHDGRLYCTVNHGRFNVEGAADSWIYVYDAHDLTLLERYPVPDLVFGAGAITHHDGRFFVAGGLPRDPERYQENIVYEYTPQFELVRRHVLPSGWTQQGIQTAAVIDGRFYFGCYGSPAKLLVTDTQLNLLGVFEFEAANGLAYGGDGRALFITDRTVPLTVRRARPSEEFGLVEIR